MNILKLGLLLITGAGFGFGIDKLADTEILPNDDQQYYGHIASETCHGDDEFFERLLENLNEDEIVLVQGKIDELLLKYDVTLEDLHDDFEIRFDFMSDLMTFLDENEIDYHNHGYYNEYDENWGRGMGMH